MSKCNSVQWPGKHDPIDYRVRLPEKAGTGGNGHIYLHLEYYTPLEVPYGKILSFENILSFLKSSATNALAVYNPATCPPFPTVGLGPAREL
jgi:hypothetical protein